MYRLFTDLTYNPGTINSPLMDRIRKIIMTQYQYTEDLVDKFSAGYVRSDHVLMKLIYILSEYLNNDTNIYRLVSEDLHSICSSLGFTSETTVGKIHLNTFYSSECLIVSTTFEDQLILSNETPYQDLRPVRCLTHPYCSMELFIPSTDKRYVMPGLSAIAIDIPLFAYTFSRWLVDRRAYDKANGLDPENLSQFIVKQVLNHMFPEYIDIALRNRLPYIHRNKAVPSERHERSFVTSYEQAIIHPIHGILDQIDASRLPYRKALKEIPFIFSDSYFDAVPKCVGSLNQYSYWTTLLIFTEWTYPLIDLISSEQSQNTDIQKIFVRIDRYLRSSGALNHMPSFLKADFFIKYEQLKEHFS